MNEQDQPSEGAQEVARALMQTTARILIAAGVLRESDTGMMILSVARAFDAFAAEAVTAERARIIAHLEKVARKYRAERHNEEFIEGMEWAISLTKHPNL